jgi:hypothetical protein
VIVLSGLYLYGITETRFRDMLEIARVSGEQVKMHLLETIRIRSKFEAPDSLEEGKRLWRKWIREDPQLRLFLIGTIASSGSVVEILIADEAGRVIASSTRRELTSALGRDLATGRTRTLEEAVAGALGSARLRFAVPAGGGGRRSRAVHHSVVVSSVLLRDAVVPELRGLALVSLLCVVVSAILAGLLANLAARPLAQLSRMIDLVAQGKGRRVGPGER